MNFRNYWRQAHFPDILARMPSKVRNSGRSRSQEVYERLKADIFAARLAPGHRLKFPELCERYETSVGAAREALTRLKLERLVTVQPNQGGQGYAVVDLSVEVLLDLTSARMEIEGAAFRSSVLHGSAEWEADVVGSHHLLSRLDVPRDDTSDSALAMWAKRHEAFHRTLIAGCPSGRLRDIATSLREEAELYRRWAVPMVSTGGRDVAAEHQHLVDAALERDAELAQALLRQHLSITTERLLASHAERTSSTTECA